MSRRSIMITGMEEEDMRKLTLLGEVTLEEDAKEISLDGLDCERVLAEIIIPDTLASTSYNYVAFLANDKKAFPANANIYTGAVSYVLAEIEIIDGGTLGALYSVKTNPMYSNHLKGLSKIGIEKINKASFSHAAGDGLLPAGTTMTVWGC